MPTTYFLNGYQDAMQNGLARNAQALHLYQLEQERKHQDQQLALENQRIGIQQAQQNRREQDDQVGGQAIAGYYNSQQPQAVPDGEMGPPAPAQPFVMPTNVPPAVGQHITSLQEMQRNHDLVYEARAHHDQYAEEARTLGIAAANQRLVQRLGFWSEQGDKNRAVREQGINETMNHHVATEDQGQQRIDSLDTHRANTEDMARKGLLIRQQNADTMTHATALRTPTEAAGLLDTAAAAKDIAEREYQTAARHRDAMVQYGSKAQQTEAAMLYDAARKNYEDAAVAHGATKAKVDAMTRAAVVGDARTDTIAPKPQPIPGGLPQLGEVRRGYRFKGGDPANPASWEPAS